MVVHGEQFECNFSHLRLLIFENFSNHGGQFECNFRHLRLLIFENFPNHGGLFEYRLCPVLNVKVDCCLNNERSLFLRILVPFWSLFSPSVLKNWSLFCPSEGLFMRGTRLVITGYANSVKFFVVGIFHLSLYFHKNGLYSVTTL